VYLGAKLLAVSYRKSHTVEKAITMAARAYEALKAAAELAGHPEVVARTILAARDVRHRVSLDEAFPETVSAVEETTAVASYRQRAYEKA
jgi:hypothetical protein